MVQTKNRLTLEEFLKLPPGEEDITYELIEGEATPKMSPKYFHSKLTRTLLYLIDEWCEGKGQVCPEWAVKLTCKGKDWVPVPEILYVSYERLSPEWIADEACPVLPNLVIEIISPGQTFGQLMAKAQDYLDAGVLRVWVVDSKARSITVFYPDAPPETYMGEIPLIDSLFEGLELTAEQVFSKAGITKKMTSS
ncbi:MAG: Uma2 family endonuclease [Okeania sp. SIO3B5]|uniref:Uma2 family endonuclease n=1 Tax=Okeania sp. SIO3B5 TaxID=2607811 RepID=UPI0013FF3684|nr:Uma2 family endonuclease [Okeania sp. SIO3B5]NEO58518.1 Uma2 family endonuclease [Okeania sp. SIO3B5]